MNRILWIILAIVTGFFTFGGGVDEPEPEPEPPGRGSEEVRRTILVYMAARNNLSSFARLDISEMLRAEIPSDCRLVVFRSLPGDVSDLIEIYNGKIDVLKTYDEGVVGADDETLKEVLADVRTLAPARENGVIFWSHSTGWKAPQRVAPIARSFGEEGGRQIEIPALAEALRTVPKFDFVFFDSCYMGCVEVAYEIRHAADYMVASVCEVPTEGMPYNLTLPYLFAEDLVDGLHLTIDTNVEHYRNNLSESCPSTMSLIDLSTMDALAKAAAPILSNRGVPKEDFQYFSVSTSFRNYFVDMEQYMEQVSTDEDALKLLEFQTALKNTVLHENHTDWIWNRLPILTCCGLSINPDPTSTTYGYQSLAWTIDTQRNNY